jgi:hypothetical protein
VPPQVTPPPPVLVRNEFSVVELTWLARGDSLSLVVTDPATGRRTVLDATELEALVRAPHELFRALLREAEASHDDPA